MRKNFEAGILFLFPFFSTLAMIRKGIRRVQRWKLNNPGREWNYERCLT